MHFFLKFISVIAFSVCVHASIPDLATNESFSLEEEQNFRPPHFTLPIYKATLVNDKIAFLDGPVIMDNANDGMYFIITSDNYEDYSIHLADTNKTIQKELQLEMISSLPLTREFDVIILEALDEDLVPVSRTTVLLFNSDMSFDMYRMTFKVDSQEYIILNFFYFKCFLTLLTVTGLLILFIELHEIVKNVKAARKNHKYQTLENI
ncbi:unnamed protein product [Ceutorhynchus assimilis]|uniref:Uncharacterized protein n=1 Tax=Ceutorhynchus assimilis TaxID=467358 RepID=A0A9N9MZR9_9CUCU|nr:unnamed protein product [Ceutorhynchus assimilis]